MGVFEDDIGLEVCIDSKMYETKNKNQLDTGLSFKTK